LRRAGAGEGFGLIVSVRSYSSARFFPGGLLVVPTAVPTRSAVRGGARGVAGVGKKIKSRRRDDMVFSLESLFAKFLYEYLVSKN